ncbi:hypothetical protein [Isoalcanivorax indicus]|uniref:hypothetical protein n=1 Tax=Isoalcanivorax indicus TaxID=2202653 RepID=UPI0013C429A5|nr:hypothetical protein [Isoalcanivorax indicus]
MSSEPLVILTTSDADLTVMCAFAEALSEALSKPLNEPLNELPSESANETHGVVWRVVDGLQAYPGAPAEVCAALHGLALDWQDPGRPLSQAEAVFFGLRASRGTRVLLMAPDMIDNIRDLPRFLEKMDQGFEVVAGWRASRVGISALRRMLTVSFNRLVARLFSLPLHDINTCMGLMSGKVVDSLVDAPEGCPSPALNTACTFRDRLAEIPITVREIPGRKSAYTVRTRFAIGVMRLREVIRFRAWIRARHAGK